MATTRREGIQVFESQFPIVATNLRALVSSWLPPAREPSPVDDEKPIDGQSGGRHERLALGAKLSTSQPSTQFQNRMNRKMGISPIRGTYKTDVKKQALNGGSTTSLVDANGKRKADSDSEEDSKSRLIKKLSSKKLELTQPFNKKKISNSKSIVHTAIIQTSPKPSNASPTQQHLPVASESTTNESSNTVHFQRNGTAGEAPSIPLSTDIRTSNDSQVADDDEIGDAEKQERKRLKKEKKKELKRLKKLEKRGELT